MTTIDLSDRDLDQILSALRNRGDHLNADPQWSGLVDHLAAHRVTKHTCNPAKPGKPLPFGKRDPKGQCLRCRELDAGATPREAPAWTSRYRENGGHPTTEELRDHFSSAHHRSGGCGPVCTFGDW